MKKIYITLIILFAFIPAYAAMKPDLQFIVQGVEGDLKTNVISRLNIELQDENVTLNTKGVEQFAHDSIPAVKAALAPYGYYTPNISVTVNMDQKHYRIQYNIQRGKPVIVASVNIKIMGSGESNKKINRYIQKFPIKKGEIFNSINYVAARDKLFDIVSNEGYIKAIAGESKVIVKPLERRADIYLIINTHERYYFGKLVFNQNAYDPLFMERFNIFREDEPFSSNHLLEYQQDMNGSRYFKQVLVVPDLNHPVDYHIPMQASIIPVTYRRYDMGIGYGTFTGPRLTAGLHLRRLTTTGHSLDALLKLSSVLSGIGLKYNIPGKNPLTDQWVLGVNFQKFKPKNGSSHSKSIYGGYSEKWKHWTWSLNLNYLWERYSVNNKPYQNSQLLYPNLNLSYLKTDNIVRPSYGRSFNFMLQGASNQVISSTRFLQAETKGKLFMSPFSFAHVIVRGDIGYTLVHELTDLPLSMRFITGGMTSVRGFPDSSIGPGKYLGVASIEYRNHIAYDFSGAVFYDVGNATNHIGDPLNRGAGVGLIYESMLGPIKLYVAEAVSKRGHPHAVEFSIGPEF